MKKLLLLFCAVLLLCGNAWAQDLNLESTDATIVDINAHGFGFTLPDGAKANQAYSFTKFKIYLRSGYSSLYMAVATERATSTSFPASKVIAISTNKPATGSGAIYFDYEFTGLELHKGVTYYMLFINGNTPNGEGNYTVAQQGIRVGTTKAYAPGVIINSFALETSKWPPIYSATAKEGLCYTYAPGNGTYTSATSSAVYANKWVSSDGNSILTISTNSGSSNIDRTTGGFYADTYNLTVPNGYVIKSYSFKATPSDGTTATMKVGETTLSTSGTQISASSIDAKTTSFTVSGTSSGKYVSVSDFVVIIEPDPDIATMVTTLKTNMETYKDLSGVGYPKADAAARTTLNAAYAVLNGYDGSTTNYTKAANYAGQLDAYNKYLKCSDIVMPIDGKVYKFTNIQKDNSTKQYVYAKDNHDLELNSTAVTDGTERFVCHAIDAANGIYSFVAVDGYYMVGATSSNGKAMSDTYTAAKQRCTIAKYTISGVTDEIAFGKVYIKFDQRVNNTGTAYLIAYKSGGWSGNGGLYISDTESSMFILDECSDYYNKVTLTSDGTDAYASLYLPFSVTIPEGITAYAVARQDGTYAHMETIVTNGILPKEKAAILKKAGQTTTETIYLSPAEAAGELPDGYSNLLNGTVAENQAPSGGGTTYVLSNLDGIGLYEYEGEHLARGKAYLFVPSGSVKALTFDFGDADAIGSIANSQEPKANSQIFNLAGQRLSKAQKGVNIVNGKKVLVK